MNRAKGFTLIEILLAIAIIAMLAGILFPVFSKVRVDARRATSTSNLRQCWMALRQYCDDHGGDEAMPTGEAATQVLDQAPTCDPNDTWRQDCNEVFGPPLIGSYGYVRAAEGFYPPNTNKWKGRVRYHRNPTLLVSIYYASIVPKPFHGEGPPWPPQPFTRTEDEIMPDRVLKLRLDGSVRLEHQDIGNPPGTLGGGTQLMTWSVLFSK